jgi:aquaporin Z
MIAIWLIRQQSVIKIAIVLGLVIFFEAWLAGPFTGASMNPIRSIAPAVLSGNIENLWIYITAPLAAALVVFFGVRKSNKV